MVSDIPHSPEQAQQIILDCIQPLGEERIPISKALNRVLAQDAHARHDNPPHDNSAMDGFAVRYDDIKNTSPDHPVHLKLVEDIAAGHLPQHVVGSTQASRIMTGGILPPGADTVIMVEDTHSQNDGVDILEAEEPEANIRRRAEDMQAGDTIVSAGSVCGIGEIGALAAQQHTFLTVRRQPTVAIFSTGNELAEIDEPLTAGKIVNSNTTTLASLCEAHGAVPVMLPTAGDTPADTRRVVEMAMDADFAISSGGVSVGEHDYVKEVLEDMGAITKFWRVAMKPGKPLFFCTIAGKPYFGVPGNPVSSMMSFLQFVRPAVRKAGGYDKAELFLPEVSAVMENHIGNDGQRRNYLRARLCYRDGLIYASTQGDQGSHMITSMLGNNGFIVLEPDQDVNVGDTVRAQLYDALF